MKLQILSTIVALSATAASADSLTCGQVKALYQDSTCCNAADASCVGSLTAGQGLTLSATGELSLVTGTTATTALAGNTVTISTLQSNAITDTEAGVAALGTKMSAAETTIAAEEAKLTALEGKMSAAESTIAAEAAKVATHHNQLSTAEATIVAEKAKVLTLEGKMTVAESTIAAEKAKVVTLQGEMSTAESTITAEKAKVVTLQGKMSTAESTIAAEEAKVAAEAVKIAMLQTTSHTEEAKVVTLTSKMSTAESTIAAEKAKVVTLTSKMSTAESTIAAEEAKVVTLTSRMSAAETTITAEKAKVVTLTSRMSAAETTITAEKAKVVALTSRMSAAETTITAEKAKVVALASRMSAAESGKQNTIVVAGLNMDKVSGLTTALNAKASIAALNGKASTTALNFASGLTVGGGGATVNGHTGTKTVRTYFANTQGISCHGPGVNRISTVADCHLAYQSLIYDKSLEYPINNPQAAMAGSYIGVSSADPAGCLYQTQRNGNAANKYYFNTNTAGIGSTVGNIQLCSKDIVMDASSPSLGLEVSNAVVAKSFHAQSDQRIKKDITDADTGALLQKINALRMRNYGYIENAETTVGFIAQELEAVDDSFTSTTRRPIPDIRKTMDGAFSEGTLTLDLDGTEVAVGDTLKVELTGGAQELTVLSVENGQASVATDIEQPDGPVYVHGRIVDDFLVINKDRIMATAVGAVQELNTRLAALEVRLAALE